MEADEGRRVRHTSTMIIAPVPAGAPVGLYLHIPFCAHICPYCDFNTYAGQESLIPRYVDALCAEIARAGDDHDGRPAATIFFGGGTPSLLPATAVERILAACRDAFPVTNDAEITLEANPNGLNEAYLRALRAAGVNRLSIGAQTTQRRGLRVLGRQHESTDTRAAVQAARAAGFTNLSLDLIFGWPGQTLEQWRDDLETVLSWPDPPEHLSLYSLIVEPGTPFADAMRRGVLRLPDDDTGADMYELAMDLLGARGWHHYEVANFARDPALISRHNALYWQHGDYYGFGAGAHGHHAGVRRMNHLLPATYIAAMEAGGPAVSNTERLDAATVRGETMMLGLRLAADGIDAAAFAHRHGVTLAETFGPQIEELVTIGVMERTDRGIRLTRRGVMLANDAVARFLPEKVTHR